MAYTSKYTGGQIEEKLDMAFASSLQEKTVDISENGLTEVLPDEGYFALKKVNVNVGAPKSKWTGHADAEGLRAIGWTEEDIAYYQANGVNWDEEDDIYHKVSDENKALYGVITAENYKQYRDKIVYLPKISGRVSLYQGFHSCESLMAIPELEISDVYGAFYYCSSLVCVPPIRAENESGFDSLFCGCNGLTRFPSLRWDKVTRLYRTFQNCSFSSVPPLSTEKVTNMDLTFDVCRRLVSVAYLDMQSCTSAHSIFGSCESLRFANLDNLKISISFSGSRHFSKESLLYIINNEAATEAITITLRAYAYARLAEDADIVAALTNHPLVSLASA